MSEWTSDELEKIAAAEELQLACVRRDATLGKSVTIWVARHGDDVNHAIDAAYRTKYGRYSDSDVPPMITSQALATTTQLVPCPAGS